MNTNKKTFDLKDRKVIFSTLWIFATLNYVYADVFTLFFNPMAQKETLAMPQEAMLIFAILMETAIAMVLLSRILNYGANRWTNIAAGVFHTGFVSWSLLGTTPMPFYIFLQPRKLPALCSSSGLPGSGATLKMNPHNKALKMHFEGNS